jgi:hypothetical protein
MAKQPVEKRNTSWRISVEAKRLLELLARKAGTSQSAVFEQAIREKARREKITLDGEAPGGVSALSSTSPVPPEQRAAALERFRQLVEKARSHDSGEMTPEEIEQEVALAIREVRKQDATCLAVRAAAMPPEEQDRVMAEAASEAASLYEADLSLPVAERGLTALTALDGEEFHNPAL